MSAQVLRITVAFSLLRTSGVSVRLLRPTEVSAKCCVARDAIAAFTSATTTFSLLGTQEDPTSATTTFSLLGTQEDPSASNFAVFDKMVGGDLSAESKKRRCRQVHAIAAIATTKYDLFMDPLLDLSGAILKLWITSPSLSLSYGVCRRSRYERNYAPSTQDLECVSQK